jgi:hypothetical protein
MEVSKLDAARRQLDAAIDLYFAEGDEIAIHTLAAAAYELVNTLRTKRGLPDEITAMILPEYRKEFEQRWRKAQNFFKHADKDADSVLEFEPHQTEIRLFMASLWYLALARRTESMNAFQIWFSMHNQGILLDPDIRAAIRTAGARWLGMSRQQFRAMIKASM